MHWKVLFSITVTSYNFLLNFIGIFVSCSILFPLAASYIPKTNKYIQKLHKSFTFFLWWINGRVAYVVNIIEWTKTFICTREKQYKQILNRSRPWNKSSIYAYVRCIESTNMKSRSQHLSFFFSLFVYFFLFFHVR